MDDKYEYDQSDSWNQNPSEDILGGSQLDYDSYDNDRTTFLNTKMIPPNIMPANRDPRSKNPENLTETLESDKKSRKKNLSQDMQALTPNDYQNVYAARNRLLNDLNELPSEILKQTFEKNQALRQSRDSNFDEKKEEKGMQKKEAKNIELPETLWDLESEKELADRENGYYRGKREVKAQIKGIPKVTSTGKKILENYFYSFI